MKRIFTAAIAVAAIALAGTTLARATTFAAFTTIYITSGLARDAEPRRLARRGFCLLRSVALMHSRDGANAVKNTRGVLFKSRSAEGDRAAKWLCRPACKT